MDVRGVIARLLLQTAQPVHTREAVPAVPVVPALPPPSLPAPAEEQHALTTGDAGPGEEGTPEEASPAAGVPAPITDDEPERPTTPPSTRELERLQRLETAAAVAESFGLGFHLGGAVERITAAAGQGRDGVDSLREAAWLIERYVELVEQRPEGADLHQASLRLARTGEAIEGLKALSAALATEDGWAPRPAPEPTPEPPGATPEPPVSEPVPEPVPVVPRAEPVVAPPEAAPPAPVAPAPSLLHELALSAGRWALMVAAVVVLVLVLTLIGQWR